MEKIKFIHRSKISGLKDWKDKLQGLEEEEEEEEEEEDAAAAAAAEEDSKRNWV
ncbi:hypothetical protein ABEW05_001933 [Botrytis cinerea]